MRKTDVNADMSHQNSFAYQFGEFMDSLNRNGIGTTVKKVKQRLYYKRKGLDFSTENIYDLTRIGDYKNHGTAFVSTSKDFLKTLMDDLDRSIETPLKRELFLDCGSGKGGAIIHAKDIGFKESIGVEFAKELHEIAEENIQKLKLKGVKSIYSDVTLYDIPSNVSVIYLFNPFDEVVMDKFIDRVLKKRDDFKSDVYIIYKNASCDILEKNLELIADISYPTGSTAQFYKL